MDVRSGLQDRTLVGQVRTSNLDHLLDDRDVRNGWKADTSRVSDTAVALFITLSVVGGLWNTFFAVQALRRGYDTMYGHRFDRQREPFSFWFYSILGRRLLTRAEAVRLNSRQTSSQANGREALPPPLM